MKAKTIIVLIMGILIGSIVTYFIAPKFISKAPDTQQESTQLYSCGMHPEVISDKPGNCPICGMKLTPIKATAQDSGKAQTGEATKDRKVLYWRAPMDSTEIYDKPGKSKMGMDLIPVYEGEEAGGAGSITIDGSLQQNMNLRLAKVERRDISRVVRAYGRVTIAQDQEYAVNTKISGWIEKLYVNTAGQKVRKGDPLLEIYSPELVSTQEEYLLALKNNEKSSSSPYDNVRRGAEKMLTLARERLAYWDIPKEEIDLIEKSGKTRRTLLLRSQMTGIVTHKTVVEGDKVGPGMDLFHIADLSTIWVEAAVYESELPSIKVGQSAELELDNLMGEKLTGKVDFIYPYLDQKSRANNIRLVFKNPELLLKPEMFATVRISSLGASDSLAIPSEAVIHSGKREIVFVTKGDGKFEPREVKIGMESDDGFTQVLSGLFDDEEVVVSGQFLLDSESRTREAIAKMRAAQIQNTGGQIQEKIHGDESKELKPETGALKEDKSQEKIGMSPKTEHVHKGQVMPESSAQTKHGQVEQESGGNEINVEKFYACPMHPEFITTNPGAKCPVCGMKVVKASELGEKVDLEHAEFFTCPMHPDFLTTDKNGRCPECGMTLEKAKKE